MLISLDYTLEVLQKLLAIDSPVGFTHRVTQELHQICNDLGYDSSQNQKGNAIIELPGINKSGRALSAHVDTLGLMVRSISSSGTLNFVRLGGMILPTVDGEYCKIYTRCGKVYTGTILSTSPAGHVHPEANTAARDEKNM